MKKKSEPFKTTKGNGGPAFHHDFFEKTGEFFRETWDKITNFFIQIFIAVARFFRLASRFIAYGSFYAIFFSALFMCVKWLALPTFIFLGHPFAGIAAAVFLLASVFLLGVSLYGIARYLDKNIHAAIAIPYKRKANTKFIELMDKFDMNEGVKNKTNQHSYFNELNRGLNDTLTRLAKEKKYDKMNDILKMFDIIERECGNYAAGLKSLAIMDSAIKNDIIRLRVPLLLYLKMAKYLEFTPQQIDNKCQDVLKKSLKAIVKTEAEENEVDSWMGKFVRFVNNLTDKNEADDVAIEKVTTLMYAVWKLIDSVYYADSKQTLTKTQFWSAIHYLLTDTHQKNRGGSKRSDDLRDVSLSGSDDFSGDYDKEGRIEIDESLIRPPPLVVPKKFNGKQNAATRKAANYVTQKTVSADDKSGLYISPSSPAGRKRSPWATFFH
jgi:hypothetical protein